MPEGATTEGTQPPATDADLRASVADLVRKADRNPHRVARTLLTRIAELERKLDTAVPAGATVLTGDDAKAFEAYTALGKPEDVKAKLGKVDELTTTLAQRDARDARRKVARDGAAALGWNPDALATLADDKSLTLDLREAEVDDGRGGTVKKQVPHVLTGEGATAKAEPIDVVAARDFAVYLPALAAQPASTTTARPAAPAMPPAPRETGVNGQAATQDAARAIRRRAAGAF